MARKRTRTPVTEEDYRAQLWGQVSSVLDRDGKTEADLSRAWGKSKSTVKRLKDGQLPTTLENLDGIASALGMELGELVWPLIHPVDPATAERRAASQTRRAQASLYKRLIDLHMSGLMNADAQELLRLAGILGSKAPDELTTVIDMLEGLAERRWPAREMFGLPGPTDEPGRKQGGRS